MDGRKVRVFTVLQKEERFSMESTHIIYWMLTTLRNLEASQNKYEESQGDKQAYSNKIGGLSTQDGFFVVGWLCTFAPLVRVYKSN